MKCKRINRLKVVLVEKRMTNKQMMPKEKKYKRRGRLPKIEVVDLFCGIGGLSYGMKSKGFIILEGFDLDATCEYAYKTNNDAKFVYKDIRKVTKDEYVIFQGRSCKVSKSRSNIQKQ